MSVASLSSELKGVQPGTTTVIDQGSGQAIGNCFCLSPPFLLCGLDGPCLHLKFFSMPLVGQEGKGTPLDK